MTFFTEENLELAHEIWALPKAASAMIPSYTSSRTSWMGTEEAMKQIGFLWVPAQQRFLVLALFTKCLSATKLVNMS